MAVLRCADRGVACSVSPASHRTCARRHDSHRRAARTGRYEVVTVPLEDLRRARADGRGAAGQRAGGARGAGDCHSDLHARQPRPASRRRVRPLRSDALSGDAHGDARHRARGAGDGGTGAALSRGTPATVYYSASCGGRTEKPSNVWPGAEDPPYLPSQADDGCGGAPEWSTELSLGDLQRALAAAGFTGTLRNVRDRRAERVGPRVADRARRPDAAADLRPGPSRRRRPDARLAVPAERGVRADSDRATRSASPATAPGTASGCA